MANDNILQVRAIFDQFKSLYKNSNEKFNPSLENVSRWRWMIEQATERASREVKPFSWDFSNSAKKLAQSRAFATWDEIPMHMQKMFFSVASRFPGREVFATGSRVNGEYIDADSPAQIVRMRDRLLKARKKESDYDIFIQLLPGEKQQNIKALLPSWADLVISDITGNHKILIPMWDFSKLPKEEHKQVLELFQGSQWGRLMDLHNQYQLSPNYYCCDDGPVRRWFGWAIENGIISED